MRKHDIENFCDHQNNISYLKINSNFLSRILEDYLDPSGNEDFSEWCLDDLLIECEERLGYTHYGRSYCYKILDTVDESWWEI